MRQKKPFLNASQTRRRAEYRHRLGSQQTRQIRALAVAVLRRTNKANYEVAAILELLD